MHPILYYSIPPLFLILIYFFSECGSQADVDNNGTIDYGEFIAATLHLNKIEREDHLFAAFSYFDKDGSGYITEDELQQACEEFGIEDAQLEEMIREVDQDNVMPFSTLKNLLMFRTAVS